MPEAPVVTVEVTDPDGNVVTITATVSNLQEFPEGGPYEYATWDFSATYTPPKPGTYTYTKTATNTFGSNSDSESGEFTVEDCPLQVEIDIKPGSCPNPFNAKSKGNVPVAIVGSADVDVTTIDPASIKLEGVAPLRWSIEDVTEPGGYDPEDCFDCFEEPAPITLPDGTVVKYSGDGIPDLVMQFDTQALAAAMRPAVRDECVVLTLKGVTSDGCNSIVGSDSVIIRTKIK
jgi:PKD repeat protein